MNSMRVIEIGYGSIIIDGKQIAKEIRENLKMNY